MTNYTARFAGVATLALAILPVAALTTAAHASSYVPAAVRVADLDLASASGRTAFDRRLDNAARHFCAREASLDLKAACETAVRAEVMDKIAGETRLASRN